MKPLLYTFVSEETLHSMAVTFYACVKLPIQIINEHGKTLVSEGESPHFCHLFQKHLPSYDSCEKCTFLPVRRRSIWARPIFLPAMQT